MIERPTSATIIGWLFIAMSILMILSGTMALAIWSLAPAGQFSSHPSGFANEPWAFQMMFKVFEYFQYLIVVQFLLAAAGIAGGIGLLRLRPWGRTLTETLTWLGLLYTVGYSILWLTGVSSFTTAGEMPPEGRFFTVLMFLIGVVVLMTFLVPFIVVLVALRGKKIRAAIELKSREPQAPPQISSAAHTGETHATDPSFLGAHISSEESTPLSDSGTPNPQEAQHLPDPDEVTDIVQQWIERGWTQGDSSVVDELHAPDFIDHDPGGRSPDNQGFKEGIVTLYHAFPDLKAQIEDLVVDAAAGTVAVRWSAVGTHTHPYLGASPTGTQITFKGIEIVRIRNGRITERWGEWDGIDLLTQLDLVKI